MTPLGGVLGCDFGCASLPPPLCPSLSLPLLVPPFLFFLFLFVLLVFLFFAFSFFLALLVDWSGFSCFMFALPEDFFYITFVRYVECTCAAWRFISQPPRQSSPQTSCSRFVAGFS